MPEELVRILFALLQRHRGLCLGRHAAPGHTAVACRCLPGTTSLAAAERGGHRGTVTLAYFARAAEREGEVLVPWAEAMEV